MKLKFLSNNLNWTVKSQLETVEKEFKKCGITLDISLEKTNIPIKWDTTWGNPVYTDYAWFYSTIIPLAKGAKIIALGIGEKEWKPTAAGWHKSPHEGVHGIEVKVYGKLKKAKSGKPWLVYILSHEICHALFKMERITLNLPDKLDQTHNYMGATNKKWQLKQCLSHLDPKFLTTIK